MMPELSALLCSVPVQRGCLLVCALVECRNEARQCLKAGPTRLGTLALAGLAVVCECVQPPVHAVAMRVRFWLWPVFDVTPTCVGRFMVAEENPLGCASGVHQSSCDGAWCVTSKPAVLMLSLAVRFT